MNEFLRNMNEKYRSKKTQTYDFADTYQCACYPKYRIPRKIYILSLKRMQLARMKMKIGNSKLKKHILVKAPSFVMKGVG